MTFKEIIEALAVVEMSSTMTLGGRPASKAELSRAAEALKACRALDPKVRVTVRDNVKAMVRDCTGAAA